MSLTLVSIVSILALLLHLSHAAPVPLPGTSSTHASTTSCAPQASYRAAMDAVFDGHKEHYPHILNAASRFNMCTNKRFAAFVGQISHETARLTTFYQPIDQGAGALHMLPSNWQFAFDFLAKEFPNLTQGLTKDLVLVQQAIASKIMQAPEVAYLVAGWWFTDGAAIVLNQKCKNMNTFADGMSDSGSAPNDDAVMNSVSQCIFGFGNDAGGAQRRSYIRAALQAFGQAHGSSSPVSPAAPPPVASDKPTPRTEPDVSHPPLTSTSVPQPTTPAPQVEPSRPVVAPAVPVPVTLPVPTPPLLPEAMIPELPEAMVPPPAEWPQIQGFVVPKVQGHGANTVKDGGARGSVKELKKSLRRVRDKAKAFGPPWH